MDSTTHALPATPKQIAYARSLALRNQTLLPWEVQQDRRSLSAWIGSQAKLKPADSGQPTSKQVAFAEKLARIKRRAVPDECFRDKGLMFDGRVARLTKTQSAFGAEYDSLSDMVSFGAAPALIVYEWALKGMGKLGWIAAFVYVAGAALRLARFNANLGVVDKRFFQGLPSPMAAAFVAGLVWVVNLGCIDLNQWYGRCGDYNRPDYLHFDLDPSPGATFDQVLESALVTRRLPLLAMAIPYVAHMAVRNRGTTCGSLALADPSAEMPAVAD